MKNFYSWLSASEVMRKLAKLNDNADDYARMYARPWILLILFGIGCSYFAAKADYSVLFADKMNLTKDSTKAYWYALGICIAIQAAIWICGGVIGQIIVNKLWRSEGNGKLQSLQDKIRKGWNRAHVIQLLILLPILVSALGFSFHLSMNMEDAARAESSNNYEKELGSLTLMFQKQDSLKTRIDEKTQAQYSSDSSNIADQYNSNREFVKAEFTQLRDSLKRRAKYLERSYYNSANPAKWMINEAANIKKQYLPTLSDKEASKIAQIVKEEKSALSEKLALIDIEKSFENGKIDSIYNVLQNKQKSIITTMEGDIKKSGQRRKFSSIAFGILALLISMGQFEVFKRISADMKRKEKEAEIEAQQIRPKGVLISDPPIEFEIELQKYVEPPLHKKPTQKEDSNSLCTQELSENSTQFTQNDGRVIEVKDKRVWEHKKKDGKVVLMSLNQLENRMNDYLNRFNNARSQKSKKTTKTGFKYWANAYEQLSESIAEYEKNRKKD